MADHVPYQIWMMRSTQEALSAKTVCGAVCWNAHIESFAVHARSLVKFFNNTENGSKARQFTDDYKPFANGSIPERLTRKLDWQIAHITEHRFNTDEEKLNIPDIEELRSFIDAETARFVEHLRPRFQEVWDTKKRHLGPTLA